MGNFGQDFVNASSHLEGTSVRNLVVLARVQWGGIIGAIGKDSVTLRLDILGSFIQVPPDGVRLDGHTLKRVAHREVAGVALEMDVAAQLRPLIRGHDDIHVVCDANRPAPFDVVAYIGTKFPRGGKGV